MILLTLLYLNFITERQDKKRLGSILNAITICILYLYVVTEVLSSFHAVDRTHIAFVWGIADLGLLTILMMRIRKKQSSICRVITELIRSDLKKIGNNPLVLFFIAACVGVLILSYKTVPYNWDSMIYHLPRLTHWAQNKSVGHFVSNDLRQLQSPVLAEIVNVNVYIMSGRTDNLLNLLQGISYIVNIGAVYGICCKLGGSRRTAYLSSLLYGCMPIAFAEALTTQVDEFATMWILIFTYFILDFIKSVQPISMIKNTRYKVFILSVALALGYLTKPSVLFAALMLVLWLLMKCIRRKDSWKNLLLLAVCSAVLMGCIIAPEAYRNFKTFSGSSDAVAGGRQLIATTKPNYIVESGIKNYAANLPNIYLYQGNQFIKSFVCRCATMLHVDIDDPAIAEGGTPYRLNDPQNYGHDTAPNPVIAVSFLIVMLYMLVKFRKTRWKSLTDRYTLATGIAFLIFCMAVRWEPFVVRYMLSYLALLCPVIALQVQEVEDRSGTGKGIRTLLVFLCMVDLIGLFYYHINICYNQLASDKRSDGYFVYNGSQKDSYDDLADYLNQKDYQNIGLYMGGYEYPIWAMLKDKSTRIESLGVEKRSLIYADPDFVPECIVSMEVGNVTAIKYNGVEYSLSEVIDNRIYILTRQK